MFHQHKRLTSRPSIVAPLSFNFPLTTLINALFDRSVGQDATHTASPRPLRSLDYYNKQVSHAPHARGTAWAAPRRARRFFHVRRRTQSRDAFGGRSNPAHNMRTGVEAYTLPALCLSRTSGHALVHCHHVVKHSASTALP